MPRGERDYQLCVDYGTAHERLSKFFACTGLLLICYGPHTGHFQSILCGKSQVRLDPRANARREAWENLGKRGWVVNDGPDQDGLNFPDLLGYWKHCLILSFLLLVHGMLQLKASD